MSGFALQSSYQALQLGYEINGALYEKIEEASTSCDCLAWTGAAVGLTVSCVAIAALAAMLGELLIKGLANVFGSICSKDCDFSLGLKQIFVYLPFTCLQLAFTSTVGPVMSIAFLSLSFLCYPSAGPKAFKEAAAEEIRKLPRHCVYGDATPPQGNADPATIFWKLPPAPPKTAIVAQPPAGTQSNTGNGIVTNPFLHPLPLVASPAERAHASAAASAGPRHAAPRPAPGGASEGDYDGEIDTSDPTLQHRARPPEAVFVAVASA